MLFLVKIMNRQELKSLLEPYKEFILNHHFSDSLNDFNGVRTTIILVFSFPLENIGNFIKFLNVILFLINFTNVSCGFRIGIKGYEYGKPDWDSIFVTCDIHCE